MNSLFIHKVKVDVSIFERKIPNFTVGSIKLWNIIGRRHLNNVLCFLCDKKSKLEDQFIK